MSLNRFVSFEFRISILKRFIKFGAQTPIGLLEPIYFLQC